MLRHGITARQIMTKEAFENAIAVVMALGGSTNAVLHLLAIAREAEVDLSLDDFNRVGDRVPHLGDLKPFGRFVMNDVDKVGGIPVVMKALLDAGLLHGACLTVTGKTMAENLEELAPNAVDGEVIRTMTEPIHKTGGLTILKGSLAPEGAVVKSAGFDESTFVGLARVFDGERAAMDALEAGQLKANDVVVIRYEGPKGGPGMREMLAITGAIKGAGLGKDVLLLTDGRFSGGTTGRGRWPDRLRPGWRPDPPRRGQPAARRARRRGGAGRAPRRLGTAGAEVHQGRAREVRQAGAVRRGRCGLRLTGQPRSTEGHLPGRRRT
jgi:dihydroxy-acid dehydratase